MRGNPGSEMKEEDRLISWAISVLARERKAQLFGTVTVKFQDGKITQIVTEKSEVPPPS